MIDNFQVHLFEVRVSDILLCHSKFTCTCKPFVADVPMAGKPLAGDLLDCEPLAGDLLDGEPLAGELAGSLLEGEPLPGESLAGEPISNWKVLDFCLACRVYFFFNCFDFSFLAPWRFILRPSRLFFGGGAVSSSSLDY